MAEVKTARNDGDVSAFLNSVQDEKRKEDAFQVLEWMREISGHQPEMWGKSIVGFGSYHLKYASGREVDWMRVGFSPRKQNLTLYIMPGFERFDALMSKLGKFKTGKSCLYIKKLEDVDSSVLKELIRASLEHMNEKYST